RRRLQRHTGSTARSRRAAREILAADPPLQPRRHGRHVRSPAKSRTGIQSRLDRRSPAIERSSQDRASGAWRQIVRKALTNAVEAVDASPALEDLLFGYFGIDDLRLLAFPLTILLGHIGHDFARVGPCPDRILDARRSVGQNPELIIGSTAAKTNGHQQYRPPHDIIPPCISRHKFKTLAQPRERRAIRNGHRSGRGSMSRRTRVMAGARE